MGRGVPQIKLPPSSGAQHKFSMVPRAAIERSTFDRSHGYKTVFNEGLLIPVFADDVLPGDTLHLSATMFARLTTPIKPLMDNMYLESFFFFVPLRLVWANFPKFMGEQTNPGDSTSYVIPTDTTSTGLNLGTFEDYLGIPTGVTPLTWNALFWRAYAKIYNQWFRDENMVNSLAETVLDAGSDITTGHTIQRRGKRHDYFTSCLPWPQKGTAVAMPLGTTALVNSDGADAFFTGQTSGRFGNPASKAAATPTDMQLINAGGAWALNEKLRFGNASTGSLGAGYFQVPGLVVDLQTATAATINSLRQAFQIQKLLERDARGGTRYTEIVRSHFGVVSPDARLQRSEYLGGGSTPVGISPIPQMTQGGLTGGTTPQGNLAAVGAAIAHGHGFVKSFTEHGIVLGIVCVRADLTYSQGLERMFSRSTRYDFYWPALAHIGEQAVLNKEIYADGSANDALTFGYQERYAEYRYKPSKLTNLFRPAAAGTLAVWHLSQQFTSVPGLNATFIQENAPMSRVVAVTTEPHFYFDSYMRYICARPMPVFGVPGLIDHF